MRVLPLRLKHLVHPCWQVRRLDVWRRQGDPESGDGQTKQHLTGLKQVRDLRRAELDELRQPDGILSRAGDPGLAKLEGVVSDLLAGLAQEPFGSETVQRRQQPRW